MRRVPTMRISPPRQKPICVLIPYFLLPICNRIVAFCRDIVCKTHSRKSRQYDVQQCAMQWYSWKGRATSLSEELKTYRLQ